MAVRPPLVTVIIPVFNGGGSIAGSIRSVQAQTLTAWEIICVNDGSTDETLSVIRELQKRDPHISLICHEDSRGPLKARLSGVREAKGEFIAFLDCGDRFSREGLQMMVLAATSTDSDVVVGGVRLRLPRLGSINYSRPRRALYSYLPDGVEAEDSLQSIYKGLLSGELSGSIWDKIYRRSWLMEHLPQEVDFRIGEDYYFVSAVLACARKIHFTDAEFYYWTYSGLAKKYFFERYAENLRAMDYVLDSVGSYAERCGLSTEEARKAVANKLMYQVLLGVAECYLYSNSEKKTTTFAERLLGCPEMQRALPLLEEFNGRDVRSLTAKEMTALAKEHLHSHRKFYIFTRLLNLIYRI